MQGINRGEMGRIKRQQAACGVLLQNAQPSLGEERHRIMNTKSVRIHIKHSHKMDGTVNLQHTEKAHQTKFVIMFLFV